MLTEPTQEQRERAYAERECPSPPDAGPPLITLIREYARQYARHQGWLDRPANDADLHAREERSAATLAEIEQRIEKIRHAALLDVEATTAIGTDLGCRDIYPGRPVHGGAPLCHKGCGIPVWRHG
jgi:hypothetical protein